MTTRFPIPSLGRAVVLRVSAIGLALSAGGCGVEAAPEFELLNFSPSSLDASRDDSNDLSLTLSYHDADGNLGGGLLRAFDCRSQRATREYTLPAIANPEAAGDIAITGTLQVTLADLLVITVEDPPRVCGDHGANVEAFCLTLIDAAGLPSEVRCTGPVSIYDG